MKKKSKTLAPLVLYVHISTWNRFLRDQIIDCEREMEIFLILLAIRGFANSTNIFYLSLYTHKVNKKRFEMDLPTYVVSFSAFHMMRFMI